MAFGNGPRIVTDGLVLALDAADKNSYPGTGVTWRDLSGNSNNCILTNGPKFSTTNAGVIIFDGTDDYLFRADTSLKNYTSITANIWMNVSSSNSFEAYFSYNSDFAFLDKGWGVRRQSTNNAFQYWGGTGNTGIKLYQNGNLLSTSSSSFAIVNATINNTWQMISLVATGISSWGTSNNLSIATRDDVFSPTTNMRVGGFNLYNRELSQSEILQNYNVQKSKFETSFTDAGSFTPTGVVLYLDAADTTSYPGSGSNWYDLSGNGNHFTINSTAFNSSGPKYMDFNGSYGCAKKINSDVIVSGDVTVITWTRILNSSANWRTLLRGLSSGADHQVIVQSGGWLIGMYDNTNGTGFNSSGYSQQSLPGYGTTAWNMLIWRFKNAATPYYNFSINDSPGTILGSNNSINTRFKHGFCSIGAYNNGAQSNPSNASQYWGDISNIIVYNSYLSDASCLEYYNQTKARFGL